MIKSSLPDEFKEIFEDIPYLPELLEIPGVYLAGGLLRTLMSTTEELSPEKTDIDIFFQTPQARVDAQMFLEKQTPYYKIYQCPEDKLATYVYLDGEAEKWKLQLITITYYNKIEDVIDSFDFTCTMFGTDGLNFVHGDTSISDTIDKHLVWHKITYPSSSMRRMMKYARKGYWMNEKDYQWFVQMVWEHNWEISDEKLVYVD
jgi:hypothetical protein